MRNIRIFDTTLRDGEQSPGASMTEAQKLEIAEALDRMGVDVIEAGFPVSSPVQFEAVKKIGQVVKNARVVGLARCTKMDIDAVKDALKDCLKKGIHVFLATSPLHMKYKLKKSKDEVKAIMVEHLEYARQFFDEIEFSPEDASRTEADFLIEVIQLAIAHGATTINFPDTVGYSMPEEIGKTIKHVVDNVPEIASGKVILSVHCHNDLGLACANSLAAVKNGAGQVEVTLNGIGERAGNCSLEELVMSMKVRQDIFQTETNIVTEMLYPTSKLLQNITGLMIARNKPIFGDNAFAHESGIHQHGVLAHAETYEIMKPETIGRGRESLAMGRHSGKHALKDKLKGFNVSLNDEQFTEVFERFTEIADKKKEVYDDDILLIIASVLNKLATGYRMEYFHVYTGDTILPTATVKLINEDKECIGSETGDGPVDALFNAIDSCIGFTGDLEDYTIQAVGHGQDAQGHVKLTANFEGISVIGKGSSTDVVKASALAYLNAVNQFLVQKESI